MIIGTVVMAVAGIFLNYFIMIPFYENFMPLDAIIQAGTKINPLITTKLSFVVVAVAPFNIVKGIMITVITMLVYKRISAFIRGISLHK
jgi:riboflavin transporter FmnP